MAKLAKKSIPRKAGQVDRARPAWQAAFDEAHGWFMSVRPEIEARIPKTATSKHYYGLLAVFDALAADTSAKVADKLVP